MPTYTARCQCDKQFDFVSTISERDNTPNCECGLPTERILVAPMVAAMGIADHSSFTSPIDGRTYYGRSGFKDHLNKHNVLPSSELKGEAEYQRTQRAITEKKERRQAVVDAVMKHTN